MAAFVVDREVLTGLVTGDGIVPDGPDYDSDMVRSAMARFDDIRPAAIFRCRTPDDPGNFFSFPQSLPPLTHS